MKDKDTSREKPLTAEPESSSSREPPQQFEREALLQFLLANMGDMVSRHLPDSTITYISPSCSTLLGYEPEDLVGTKGSDNLHPDDVPVVWTTLEESVGRGDKGYRVPHRIRHKDGSYVWTETVGRLIYDSAGELVEVHCNVRDISERKRTEEQLRESEERYRAIAVSAQDYIFCKDLERRYTFVNPAMERLFGCDAAELIGRTPAELFDAKSAAIITEVDDIAVGGAVANSVRVLLIGDQEHVFHAVQVPIRNATGEITGISGIVRDITDRRQAEDKVRDLERMLHHAQRQESLGVLAGGIAHDFNNILMGVLGWADLALRDLPEHSPARESIAQIEASARRAAGLANQMLAYSGKGQFVFKTIRLDKLVDEMLHLLEVAISKNAALSIDHAVNLPGFNGDASQVRQIIMNLITNASEAVGDASGVISISTGVKECDRQFLDDADLATRVGLDEPLPEGRYVFVEVTDTGEGMNESTRAKIFEPFFTTKFAGRGLGLAGTLGIVRGHRGAIRVASEPGKGTTFQVLFPATDSGLPDGPAAAGAEKKSWSGRGTVLLVDDEPTVCKVGTRMLERLGFDVLTAADGREALDVFREHSAAIVCILLDMTMPHLDGEQVLRELRSTESKVKVILSSGFSEQDATEAFVDMGLAGFLQKPYNLDSLQEKLQEVLGE